MNSITIAGQLGKDAEVRYMSNGDPVCTFSVADNQGKDKQTIWWRCSLLGKRAESLSQYLTKGQAVTVSGIFTERDYTDKDGAQKKAQEVRVNDVALQGGRKDAEPRQAAPARQQAPQRQRQPANDFSDMDSDIPFADPMKRRSFTLAI